MVGPGHRCPTPILLLPLASIGPNKHHGGDGNGDSNGRLGPPGGVGEPVGRTRNQHHEPLDVFSFSRVVWKWPSVPIRGGNHVHIVRIPTDEVLREAARADSAPRTPPPPATSRRSEHNPDVSPSLKCALRYDAVQFCGAVLRCSSCSSWLFLVGRLLPPPFMPSVHPWDHPPSPPLRPPHHTHSLLPGSRILTIHMAVTVGKASHLAARMSHQVPPLTNRWLKAVSGSSV